MKQIPKVILSINIINDQMLSKNDIRQIFHESGHAIHSVLGKFFKSILIDFNMVFFHINRIIGFRCTILDTIQKLRVILHQQ